jgi:hypothetical protein
MQLARRTEQLHAWLSRELPNSSSILHDLVRSVSSDDCQIYLDNEDAPTAAMCLKLNVTRGGLSCCLHATVPLSQKVAFEICTQIKISMQSMAADDAKVTFRALDCRHIEVLTSALTELGLKKLWDDPTGLYILPRDGSRLTADIPAGYVLHTEMSKPSCAQRIDDLWKYKSPQSLPMIQHMLNTFPNVGLMHSDSGVLAAWMLTYEDGAAGVLYVDDAHRRQGLARAVVASLVDAYYRDKARCFGADIQNDFFCYIVDSNKASEALFLSLGFRRVQDMTWIGFTFA